MKRGVLVGFFVILLIVGVVAWFNRFKIEYYLTAPKPRSDLEIINHITWLAFQDALTVTGLKAEAVDPKVGLFENRFLIRYRIDGVLQDRSGSRPTLRKAHVSSRIIEEKKLKGENRPTADIKITPIVEVLSDEDYEGEKIQFSIVLEELMETMGWGDNHYVVRCEELQSEVVVPVYKYPVHEN